MSTDATPGPPHADPHADPQHLDPQHSGTAGRFRGWLLPAGLALALLGLFGGLLLGRGMAGPAPSESPTRPASGSSGT